jgi:hypothetical protein
MLTTGKQSLWVHSSKFPGLWLAILLLLYFINQSENINYRYDASLYLTGAKALAEGRGYRMVTHEGSEAIGLYPPLQSFFLSAVWRLYPRFPDNVWLLNLAMYLLGIAVLGAFYYLLLQYGLPRWLAGLITASLGISPNWYLLLILFSSEPLFVLISFMLAIFWLRENQQVTWISVAFTGLSLGLLYLARTGALAIMVATCAAVGYGLIKQKKAGWLALLAIPVLASIMFWRSLAGEHLTYYEYFQRRIVEIGGWQQYPWLCIQQANHYLLGRHFLDALCPGFIRLPGSHWASNVQPGIFMLFQGTVFSMHLALCICAFIGWCAEPNKVKRVIGAMVIAYLAQLIAFPSDECGYRYVIVTLPFVIGMAWQGIMQSAAVKRAPQAILILTASLLIAAGAASGYLCHRFTHSGQAAELEELKEIGEWIKQEIPGNAKIEATFDLSIIHLHYYCGRQFTPLQGFAYLQDKAGPNLYFDYLVTRYPWSKQEFQPNLFNNVDINSVMKTIVVSKRGMIQILKTGGPQTAVQVVKGRTS